MNQRAVVPSNANASRSIATRTSSKPTPPRPSISDHRPAAAQLTQLAAIMNSPGPVAAAVPANRTGLPDTLKAGVERLSGHSLSDVRVHRNSPKPAQLNAHAFAQGKEIHLAPGQEKHLPHEAWHVVQQAQGRVKPTLQAKGIAINDDRHLEAEADRMGSQAAQMRREPGTGTAPEPLARGSWPMQFVVLQRITFERSKTGAIGGFFGRTDAAATRWTAAFNALDNLVTTVQGPLAGVLNNYRDFAAERPALVLFVNGHRAQHVLNANRNTVGAQIEQNLAIAQRIDRRRADYVTMGRAKSTVIGGLDAAEFAVYDAVGPNILSLLTAHQLGQFFGLPQVALDDFATIGAIRQRAILRGIAAMIHVASLDRAYHDYAGNAKQGHTFSEHGAHHSDAYMMARADANGTAKGRWLDFGVQRTVIAQAEAYMWNPATYGAAPNESALRAAGNAYIHPAGIFSPGNLATLRGAPNFPQTKKKVDIIDHNYGGQTGTSFFPLPGGGIWNLWNPTRPAPQVANRYTVIFQLEPGVAFRVLTAYPVV